MQVVELEFMNNNSSYDTTNDRAAVESNNEEPQQGGEDIVDHDDREVGCVEGEEAPDEELSSPQEDQVSSKLSDGDILLAVYSEHSNLPCSC